MEIIQKQIFSRIKTDTNSIVYKKCPIFKKFLTREFDFGFAEKKYLCFYEKKNLQMPQVRYLYY